MGTEDDKPNKKGDNTMAEIIKDSWTETIVQYELAFDDGRGNGFGFPCDENGNLLEGMHEAAIKNYKYCLENPGKFNRFNEVVKYTSTWRHRPTLLCNCGEEFELYRDYMGACSCPKCNQWYNLFGQELTPPSQWEEEWGYEDEGF